MAEIPTTCGDWTVLEEAPQRDGRRKFWCRCACGFRKAILLADLRAGRPTCCISCSNKRHARPCAVDELGRRYGRLVVVDRAPNNRNSSGRARWRCKCDCGDEAVVDGASLRAGTTRSCGCLRDELTRSRNAARRRRP